MLDVNYIRENKEKVREALIKRMKPEDLDLDKVLTIDDERKKLNQQADELKAERNKHSKTKPTPEIIEKMKTIGEEIKGLDEKINQTNDALRDALGELPNIPANDVPAGGKEANQVIESFGTKPHVVSKDHYDAAVDLGIIDYERGVKIGGNGFWVYRDKGAILEWALLNYFIDYHRANGYTFIMPPYLLTEQSAYTSGHLPKFRDDLFWTQDKLCLNATSEMMLGNYHRDEVLPEEMLPIKYFAFSTCFRREAGSYRKEERGMIRGHQFNKIELFQFTKPEDSDSALNELIKIATELVEGLGLHFRTSLLSAGDASAAMAKTVDIEVWIPSMEIYKEVSSASNATDYQARRGNIRFKHVETGKNVFVHTLNASGLATSRLIPAILEQFQRTDGTIDIPKALHKYTGFTEISKS